jgi:hypothetical protein
MFGKISTPVRVLGVIVVYAYVCGTCLYSFLFVVCVLTEIIYTLPQVISDCPHSPFVLTFRVQIHEMFYK